jgi:hypothetical protein
MLLREEHGFGIRVQQKKSGDRHKCGSSERQNRSDVSEIPAPSEYFRARIRQSRELLPAGCSGNRGK